MDINAESKKFEEWIKDLEENYDRNKSFEGLSALRNFMATSHKVNKADDGFRNLLIELYPDNAHYIFELLQQNIYECCVRANYRCKSKTFTSLCFRLEKTS